MAEKNQVPKGVTMATSHAKRADGNGKVAFTHPVFSGDTPAARMATMLAYLVGNVTGITTDADAATYVVDATEAKIKNVLSQKARNAPDEDTRRFKEIEAEIAKGNFAHADEMPELLARMKDRAAKK